MVENVVFFESITIDPPLESIYRRLGYRRGTTVLTTEKRNLITEDIDYARSLIRLRGAMRRGLIESRDESRVALADGVVFRSTRLAAFLDGCDELLLMGATAGVAVMDAIAGDAADNNLSRAVILDATASEMVDASLDWIMNYCNSTLRRHRKGLLKRRYSAGYGDLALENQRPIYELLELHRLGVAINEKDILIPEKSVTALTGIRDTERDGRRQ